MNPFEIPDWMTGGSDDMAVEISESCIDDNRWAARAIRPDSKIQLFWTVPKQAVSTRLAFRMTKLGGKAAGQLAQLANGRYETLIPGYLSLFGPISSAPEAQVLTGPDAEKLFEGLARPSYWSLEHIIKHADGLLSAYFKLPQGVRLTWTGYLSLT